MCGQFWKDIESYGLTYSPSAGIGGSLSGNSAVGALASDFGHLIYLAETKEDNSQLANDLADTAEAWTQAEFLPVNSAKWTALIDGTTPAGQGGNLGAIASECTN